MKPTDPQHPIHSVPKPPTRTKRNRVVLGMFLGAVVLHLLICRWSVQYPGKGFAEIVRVPNVARVVVGKGPRTIYLGSWKVLGRTIGVVGGVALPLVLCAAAAFIRFNSKELSQVAGAVVCIVLGFVLVVVITWALSYW